MATAVVDDQLSVDVHLRPIVRRGRERVGATAEDQERSGPGRAEAARRRIGPRVLDAPGRRLALDARENRRRRPCRIREIGGGQSFAQRIENGGGGEEGDEDRRGAQGCSQELQIGYDTPSAG